MSDSLAGFNRCFCFIRTSRPSPGLQRHVSDKSSPLGLTRWLLPPISVFSPSRGRQRGQRIVLPHVQGRDYVIGYHCDSSDGTMVRSEAGLVEAKNRVA